MSGPVFVGAVQVTVRLFSVSLLTVGGSGLPGGSSSSSTVTVIVMRYRSLSGVCATSCCDHDDVFVIAPRVRGILEVGILFEVQLSCIFDLELVPVSTTSDFVAGDAIVSIDILGAHPPGELVIFFDLEGIVTGEVGAVHSRR